MVKQNKNKKQLRNEAEWQNLLIRKSSLKSLAILKINLDMNTYDDVIQYLLSKEGSQ
jgi:hypothetical protein